MTDIEKVFIALAAFCIAAMIYLSIRGGSELEAGLLASGFTLQLFSGCYPTLMSANRDNRVVQSEPFSQTQRRLEIWLCCSWGAAIGLMTLNAVMVDLGLVARVPLWMALISFVPMFAGLYATFRWFILWNSAARL